MARIWLAPVRFRGPTPRSSSGEMSRLRKRGADIQPIEIEGRKIARSFWGAAWCEHLEIFCDYDNRLPRGRTYVRNGSVCHLEIREGEINAKVAGSEIYDLHVRIERLPVEKWTAIKARCAGQIGSLLELLQGKLSSQVMEVVTDGNEGLFPLFGEMSYSCNCPDWASMCKHVAAALYGVGARLDHQPELLFKLRGVDHEELIAADAEAALSAAVSRGSAKRIAAGDLEDVFGIDLDMSDQPDPVGTAKRRPRKRTATKNKKPVTKKQTVAAKTSTDSRAKKSTKKSVKKKTGRTSAKKKTGRQVVAKKKTKAHQTSTKKKASTTRATAKRKKK